MVLSLPDVKTGIFIKIILGKVRSMGMIQKKILMPGAVLALFVISPLPVYAYIDPATSNYVVQIIIAGFLAAGYAIKVFWRKIKDFFTTLFKGKDISR